MNSQPLAGHNGPNLGRLLFEVELRWLSAAAYPQSVSFCQPYVYSILDRLFTSKKY